mmetsp:Transcript_10672/g.9386  ORF Transcript_10672/g.9386 Transcript_10672/m.9386 type:complete len:150 (-) Transcript_10672:709-1158(-)
MMEFLNQEIAQLEESSEVKIRSNVKSEFSNFLKDGENSNMQRKSNINKLESDTKFYSVTTKRVELINEYDISDSTKGKEYSYLHIFTDETSSQKLKSEQANREYQRIMLSSVAHEFRNPLNSISGNLDLIEMVTLEPKIKEFAKRAKNS